MCGPWSLTFVHIECYGADSDPDHALRMVEELNGLGVQGKIISVLCVGDKQVSKVQQCTAVYCCTWAKTAYRKREGEQKLLGQF